VVRWPWSEAAIERAARAVAEWAMREEMPPFDPTRQGQWASSIARFSGEEGARMAAQALENARRSFHWQRVYDLAKARRCPAVVVDRALQLLR
jgi:hypothetical protein